MEDGLLLEQPGLDRCALVEHDTAIPRREVDPQCLGVSKTRRFDGTGIKLKPPAGNAV